LFVSKAVLHSLAVTPILLAVSPTPAFDTTKPMSRSSRMTASPLGCGGMFLRGGVFSAQFGMASVYGAEAGLSVAQISIFVAVFFVGSMLLQYPIGWMSDRMDRRLLIVITAAIGFVGSILGMMMGHQFPILLLSAFIVGGMSNPLYSLLIAHTNDFLDLENMAAASGGMICSNGLRAIMVPYYHRLDDGHGPWAGGLLPVHRRAVRRAGRLCLLPCHCAPVDRDRCDQPVCPVFGSHGGLGGRSCP